MGHRFSMFGVKCSYADAGVKDTGSFDIDVEADVKAERLCFGGCTGYGHEEAGGREALDQAFAEIFCAESAIVRSQFFSGTHAITCALFAFLRPGDELLAVAGAPYDTLEEVIGIRDGNGLGSLKDFGIKYREVARTIGVHDASTINIKPAQSKVAFSSSGPAAVAPEIIKSGIPSPGLNIIAAYTKI